MEEVFRDERQERYSEDVEQSEGDSRVEQIEQRRKGASRQQRAICCYRAQILSARFQQLRQDILSHFRECNILLNR